MTASNIRPGDEVVMTTHLRSMVVARNGVAARLGGAMNAFYAGVGSRQTPPVMLEYFYVLAAFLWREHALVLRSGGAPGADSAFERGAPMADIFLPWAGFNGNRSPLHEPPAIAYDIAAAHHPAWDKLTPPVQRLMARNSQQVLGGNCNMPSRFVVCWTPNASGSGGTGQAIRIARAYDIPVFDFGKPQEAHADLCEFLLRGGAR